MVAARLQVIAVSGGRPSPFSIGRMVMPAPNHADAMDLDPGRRRACRRNQPVGFAALVGHGEESTGLVRPRLARYAPRGG
jgi:hypothetical protein